MRAINRLAVASSLRRKLSNTTSISILFAATLLFAIPLVAEAQAQITVCPSGCDYPTPEAAVNDPARVDGDTIDITTGTYVLGETLLVDDDITINGNDAVLDADGNRAVGVPGLNTVIINNLTIRNARDPGEAPGGAISIIGGGTLTLNGLTVEDSSASDGGGGLYNFNSTVEIFDSAFLRNDAGGAGGAINTRGANAVTNLTRVTIDGNTAFSRGGGLTAELDATINVFESTVSRNAALAPVQTVSNPNLGVSQTNCGADPGPVGQSFIADAAALSSFEVTVQMFGSGTSSIPNDINIPGQVRQGDGQFAPIIATASAFAPGGVWTAGSNHTLTFILDHPLALIPGDTYSIEFFISGNYAYWNSPDNTYLDGGLIGRCSGGYGFSNTADLAFSTFGGYPKDGGGIYSAGTVNLQNSTVSGNVGDGAFASAGNNTVGAEFSTIVNNSGNGLTAEAGNPNDGGIIAFGSSILAGNFGSDCLRDNLGALSVSMDFNLIGDIAGCQFIVLQQNDQAGGDGLPVIDPLLGILQDNGGSTFTHALDAGSPAVDAGGACHLSNSPLSNDQRGTSRPQADACDIGSFEFAVPATYTVCPSGCNYPTPEDAVNDPARIDGDIVDITTGTYVLGATLEVNKNMTIQGNDSVLDANGIQAINVSGATTNFSLGSLTIRNGQAQPGTGGGALRISGGSQVNIVSGIFENNQADFGGAIYNNGSTLFINVAEFSGNRATNGDGGALLTDGLGISYLDRTLIDGNLASNAGGGVAVTDNNPEDVNERSQINLNRSTVSNNTALGPVQTVSNLPRSGTTISCGPEPFGQTFIADEAALSAFEFDIRLNGPGDLTVIPNDLDIFGQVRQGGPAGPVIATAVAFAPGSTWLGGSTQTLTFVLDRVVALVPGDTYAIESAIAGAYSIYISPGNDYPGGSEYTCDDVLVPGEDLTFRTFGGAPGEGSGIHSSAGGFAGVTNTTVSGNVGDGILATSGGLIDARFNTITNNSGTGATAIPGEPGPVATEDGLVFITATIIAGNGDDCDGDMVTSGYNLIGDDTNCVLGPEPNPNDIIGTSQTPVDPLLGPLQYNGGRTPTHAIDGSSPAFDAAGPNDSPLPCFDFTNDQRDVARPNGPACDIGAFEFAPPVGPLQTLIDAAEPGAIIDVDDGVYTESLTIGDGKTLRGSSADNVVIDASNLGVSAITATGDFTLDGIRVTGGNSASNGGGIIATVAGTNINLENTVFDNNNAGLDGGAIYLLNGTLTVIDSTFENNSADGNGGAIVGGAASTISIYASMFDSNTATAGGGSIYNEGNLSLTYTTVNGSNALVGGGIYNTIGTLDVDSSTLSNNTGSNSGGAIGGAGIIEIRNSTLSGNSASNGNGGGIVLTGGSARLNNVTLAYNAASDFGGPFYAENGALISFSNSLFSGNTGGGTNCNTVVSLGYNLFQNAPCATEASDIIAEPRINLLAPNGGLTLTHSLQGTSPAIDNGNPEPIPNFAQFDTGNFQLWQTQGGARLDAGTLLLADETTFVGSAFVTNPIDPAQDFSATFQFTITPGVEGAADGITFTISDDPSVLGQSGGFLGIARRDQIEQIAVGVVNGVSVEFDTWVNGAFEGANDPGPEHIGIDINGNLSSQALTIIGPLSDGSVWTAWIDYDVQTNTIEVRASNDGIRPTLPTVSTVADIAALTGPTAYAGFTAGAAVPGFGNIAGTHRILSFSFDNSCEPTDQRGEARPQGAGCDIGAFEGAPVPLALGPVSLGTVAVGQDLSNGESYPGVTDVRIIEIPIEKLTGDVNNSPASAPLGSFPLGSFPIGSFDLRSAPIGSFPLGSFPIGSFPIGSFPIGSFPIGSFPLSSIPLQREGGWSKVLEDIPELDGAPLQTVTLEQVLTSSSVPASVDEIELRDLAIEGSPLASLSLQGLSLGATTVEEIDQWASNAGSANAVCTELANNEPAFTDCAADDTLLSLEFKGAPVSALSLQSLPLGSFSTTAAPLGSFPIGSFPLGSFPLGSFPLGSFPIGSFPIGSFPLGSFPLGSFPIGSFPLGSFEVDGQPFCDVYDEQAGVDGAKTCGELLTNPATASLPELIAALAADGASNIGSTPLGSFPLGSFPIGSFPIGSFPLGSFPIGSFPIGSFPIGSFPIGSFPLGSFPIGSFPLGSFNIDGRPFCDYYDQQAGFYYDQQPGYSGPETCSELSVDPATASLADLIAALASNGASDISSTPLGSFPIGSFPIGSFPIGSFPLGSFDLNAPPLSDLSLGDFDGCALIESSSSDTCTTRGLSDSSTLLQVAAAYGSIEASPLGSFPLGSFGIGDLPMGSFPIGSFEINGTPLGSFPLGSFDLINSPLGSFPIGSFPLGSFPAGIVTDPTGLCDPCETLADAARAGVINPSATLADLEASTAFASVTLAEVMDAMTMATLYGDGTLEDIDDLGSLTLGQLLIAMMLKTDFPWETISLDQLDSQSFSADNFVDFLVDFALTGNETRPLSIAVTLDQGFLYVGPAELDIVSPTQGNSSTPVSDPVITENEDGTQTLVFNLVLGGFSDNTLSFRTVPPLALGDYPASVSVVLGEDVPVEADINNGTITIIPDPINDISDPLLAISTPADVLTLGFISAPDDNDFFQVTPPPEGARVSVFMSNPTDDNDLIMYAPVTAVEEQGQQAESAPLDSVPFEDDGVRYQGNISEEPNALEDVNLATAPLASISTNRGNLDETVSAIVNDGAPFTIQVSGYNGAVSDQPYTLRVKVTPRTPSPQCSARTWPNTVPWPNPVDPTVPLAGTWVAPTADTKGTNALFLVNGARLASSDPNGAAGASDALSAVSSLINAPGITHGVVVDVSTIAGVDYTDWDLNPCDVDAPNRIVNAITAYIEEQRVISPNLTYVTIVGSDEVIPFARKPDETSIANESTFAGEFSDNAMYGALVTRHFLSDDSYGDIDPIPWLDRYLNVPELGVGRLVESAVDIQTAAENYLLFGGVLDPQTALSAGYDFVADAAQDIQDTFETYSPALGFDVEPALIDQPGVSPAIAWTRADFLSATGVNTNNPVDQVSFNMHFDFDEALPSSGDASGNYSDNLINTADLAGADLLGGIWFTVGCHSGTNVPDVSVIAATPGEEIFSDDWAQAFSRLGALYLAQNAFGLGDTEALALTERLMANFARNLNGSLTIGQAHAYAKQQYFADLGLYGEYDYKALQAATLFGLPMYQYGNGATVEDPLPPALPVATDPISGLTSASWSLETNITRTSTGKGDLFNAEDDDLFDLKGGVQFVHFRPLQPIVSRDITSPDGKRASGAFLTDLVTEDIDVPDIAFARPVIDLGENEPEIESDEVVFPTAFTNIANYKAPPGDGGPFAARDQLNVIVGQFTSPLDGGSGGTERLFRSLGVQIFYRPVPTASPGSPAPYAAAATGGDFVRPEFDNVQASIVGSDQASFSIDVSDESTVLRVAVLYLKSVTPATLDEPAKGNWVLVDLIKGGGNTWTGGGPVEETAIADGQIDYMVQAVDDNGNVANSTFKGKFYVAKALPTPPLPDNGSGIGVTVDGEVPTGDWITTAPVDVTITNQDPGVSYEYSVDYRPYQPLPLPPDAFQITGDGVHIVTVRETDGSNPVTFVVLVDTTPPQVVITTPANGQFVTQGTAPAAEYDCLDAGSGITSCVGPVLDGDPTPSSTTGTKSFVVTAQDDAEKGPTMAENVYYVVKPLEVGGPVNPTAITDPVTITASATDLDGFAETVTIDWGDGSIEVVDMNGVSVSDLSVDHDYATPDVYMVTVTVDYEGQFTQTAEVDFVVIYDTQGGFVTGGGWFDSPPGAYTPNDSSDEDVTGKAHFGFVSKYKKGQSVPSGSTNFRFAAGDLEFKSTSYDWMIISGARARYKGEGTVNGGAELYKFQITALDADISGAGITEDGFRIRIWQAGSGDTENVLYDNGRGADDATGNGGTTPLGGGSIKIHNAKK